MSNGTTRREMLNRTARAAGLLMVSSSLAGCPQSGPPVTLAFKEDDAFYSALEMHLRAKTEVIVEFNGKALVESKASKFFDVLKGAENGPEVLAKIHALDTEAGRRALRSVFGPALLRHEPVAVKTKIGNDVVDVGEILLVGVAILATAIGVELLNRKRASLLKQMGATWVEE